MSGPARPKPLLTIAEAAECWGRSRSATYESARRGELPGLATLNGRYYVRWAVFEAWLAGVPVANENKRVDLDRGADGLPAARPAARERA